MAATQSNSNDMIIPGAPQNLSMRIGRSAAELARPCFTAGSSRVSRSRATKALGLRKRKAVSPQSPPSPNQESVVNPRTGKVAFGPWLGPYETNSDALSAMGPLFLDHQGNTYASLAAPGTPNSLREPKTPATTPASTLLLQPQHQLGVAATGDKSPNSAAAAEAAAAATRQLYAMVSKVVQRQALAAQAHEKPSQWPGRGKPHAQGRCRSTMARAINQPRRS